MLSFFGQKTLVICLLIAFSIYPYMFWADLLFRVGGGGSSPYVLFVTLNIALAALISSFKYISTKDLFYILIVSLCVISVALLKSAIYVENIPYASYRTFIMLMIYATALLCLLNDHRFESKVENIIVFNMAFQAIFGIIHFYFFPHIVTGIEIDDSGSGMYVLDPGQGGFRENGMLLGSNVYGNFLVLGLFLTMSKLSLTLDRKNLINMCVTLLILWGIYLSGSRFALVIALVVVAFFLIRKFNVRHLYIPLAFSISVILFTPLLDQVIERTVEHGSSNRFDKSDLAISMLTKSINSGLLGPSLNTLSNAKTMEGLPFSDNSFMLLALNYGLPVAVICFLIFSFFILKNVKPNSTTLMFCAYFIGAIFFNNAVLWDIWLFHCVAVLYIVSGEKKSKYS